MVHLPIIHILYLTSYRQKLDQELLSFPTNQPINEYSNMNLIFDFSFHSSWKETALLRLHYFLCTGCDPIPYLKLLRKSFKILFSFNSNCGLSKTFCNALIWSSLPCSFFRALMFSSPPNQIGTIEFLINKVMIQKWLLVLRFWNYMQNRWIQDTSSFRKSMSGLRKINL